MKKSSSIISIFILCLILILPSSTEAENWQYVTSNPEYHYYFDTDSIHFVNYDPNTIRVNTRLDYGRSKAASFASMEGNPDIRASDSLITDRTLYKTTQEYMIHSNVFFSTTAGLEIAKYYPRAKRKMPIVDKELEDAEENLARMVPGYQPTDNSAEKLFYRAIFAYTESHQQEILARPPASE